MIQREKVVFIHTPKTGGGAMEYFFYDQLKKIRRNYFLSFSGLDDSRFYDDNLCTKRSYGNKCLIEGIFKNKPLTHEFNISPHFQQAKMLFGHTTSSLHDMFPDYKFNYICVLRHPVERTISNIAQFSTIINGMVKFGSYLIESEKLSREYWDNIYEILIKEYPISGFQVHENFYLRNCMTHILQGSKYLDPYQKPDLGLAIYNSRKINIALYCNYNRSLQAAFNKTGIPIDMSGNLKALGGEPEINNIKKIYGLYYNAPKKIIDFIIDNNQDDIRLYNLIKKYNDC
ncbi:hypothetical protein [Methylobacter sp. S3L5C]|uniref:hypothetical protein n=1 Tax=Methylobacter sp. S3L5C TaxID=2839024 RepID=UPI001FAB8D6C|nr:hypothetical protein [Methylobacter sp. S3L5C]UOA07499.1 sulfotransferase family 2 domain-containing protein [Methylobacter sp. S3L5C]